MRRRQAPVSPSVAGLRVPSAPSLSPLNRTTGRLLVFLSGHTSAPLVNTHQEGCATHQERCATHQERCAPEDKFPCCVICCCTTDHPPNGVVANSNTFIIVSHDSISFNWVAPLLESIVAFRAAELHVCASALLHVASSPAVQYGILLGNSDEERLPKVTGHRILHI